MNIDNNIIYGILLVIAYSGVGSLFVSRLTRSRADMRNEGRALIKSNLELIEAMSKASASLRDADRRAEFDQMLARLMSETTLRIEELNGVEEAETRDPHERYLLIPPPRTGLGSAMSLLFAISAWASLLMPVLISFWLFTSGPNNEFNLIDDAADQRVAAIMMGVCVGLGALAFLFRFFAFRSFVQFVERRRAAGRDTAA